MIRNKLECTIDVTQVPPGGGYLKHPVILENKNGLIDWYYPFEMIKINSVNG